eukprot:1161923-Pelagomonas_calceolata.AAC.12
MVVAEPLSRETTHWPRRMVPVPEFESSSDMRHFAVVPLRAARIIPTGMHCLFCHFNQHASHMRTHTYTHMHTHHSHTIHLIVGGTCHTEHMQAINQGWTTNELASILVPILEPGASCKPQVPAIAERAS